MVRLTSLVIPLLWVASPAAATDFGIRIVGESVTASIGSQSTTRASMSRQTARGFGNIQEAARVAASYGQVTSTWRSAARNRAVGGVPNSFHLQGRALDVVRRRGVSHAAMAAALRQAGFSLIESLDEGDHSHFAFGRSADDRIMRPSRDRRELTNWGIVEFGHRTGGTPPS